MPRFHLVMNSIQAQISGQLGRMDFLAEQNKQDGLTIYPFNGRNLKAASYDLTPTIVAMSSKTGMLENVYRESCFERDKYYIYVHPKDTVLVVSNEYLTVPPNIAGYVSSRVSKVVEGFGHISTTIDPNWSGAALIALSNPSNQLLKVYVGCSKNSLDPPNQLATVTFHYLGNSCEAGDIDLGHRGMRLDLLKRVNYKEKRGFLAFWRPVLFRRRKEFTDYFFKKCASVESGLSSSEWELFLEDFSYLTSVAEKNETRASKKASKVASDFIIRENCFIRLYHWLVKYRMEIFYVFVTLVSLAYTMGVIPEEYWEVISAFLRE